MRDIAAGTGAGETDNAKERAKRSRPLRSGRLVLLGEGAAMRYVAIQSLGPDMNGAQVPDFRRVSRISGRGQGAKALE